MPARVFQLVWSPLLAQSSTEITTSSWEWDLPLTWSDWIPVVLLLLAMLSTVWFGWRDRLILPRPAAILLPALRLLFLVLALIIALNPHERTQTDAYRDSRVLLLVDTSQSMQQPESDPRSSAAGSRSRAAAVEDLLAHSGVLDALRKEHVVELYRFDSDVSVPLMRWPSLRQAEAQTSAELVPEDEPASPPGEKTEQKVDWDTLLAPNGMSTRLGDSLDTLLVEAKSPTLSGVVIFSDGASNAGRDVQVPRDRARQQGIRLVTVGVGSVEPPLNLEIVRIVAPTDVQKGDAFGLTAQLRGTGLAGRTVHVDLLQQGPEDREPLVINSLDQTLAENGSVSEVEFELRPAAAGTYEYSVRARIPEGVETREDDNQQSRTVNIFDRPMRVLMIAGGPLRDYRYARTILFRHPSMQNDVWLQSGGPGSNQESHQLLQKFPETAEGLYQYDVILGFDPDWTKLTPEQRELLTGWISNEGGGLIAVAGDVFTPALAVNPELESIRKLYPVLLEEVSLRLNSREAAQTAFPLLFTPEGQAAEFLKLAESSHESGWDDFPGIFLTYPTRGPKAGTTIYAEFSDPLSRGRGGQPIVIAGQRFGQGQVLYVGSPELWRLRAVRPAYLDRLWTKLVRKAAEGRSKRGLQRGMFILDGREFILGQTIPLRIRALNQQFQPLSAETMTIDAFRSDGAPVVPALQLYRDPVRPAEFTGEFRPATQGRYRLEFALPDSTERVVTEIDVQFPRQEAASLVQDVSLLKRLVDGTSGQYLSPDEVLAALPGLLPNKGERVIIDQRVTELWDRGWLMGLLAGLACLEWLTRKLLKLA